MIVVCQKCRENTFVAEPLSLGTDYLCGNCREVLFSVPAPPPPDWLNCPDCQKGFRFIICPDCKGRGLESCVGCGGEGQWLERCATCEGVGQMSGSAAAELLRQRQEEKRRKEEQQKNDREKIIWRARMETKAAEAARFRLVEEERRILQEQRVREKRCRVCGNPLNALEERTGRTAHRKCPT